MCHSSFEKKITFFIIYCIYEISEFCMWNEQIYEKHVQCFNNTGCGALHAYKWRAWQCVHRIHFSILLWSVFKVYCFGLVLWIIILYKFISRNSKNLWAPTFRKSFCFRKMSFNFVKLYVYTNVVFPFFSRSLKWHLSRNLANFDKLDTHSRILPTLFITFELIIQDL